MKVEKASFKNLNLLIPRALKLLKIGKVIICPTDTVYGLVASATNKKAVKRVFEIKKREKGKPIPIFVKNIKMAKKLALVEKEQEKFLKKVWPGKVTVVLKRKKNCGLPAILFGGKKTIGLRIPNYRLINGLLKKLNKPLTGTSANISGKSASTKIKEVLKQFEDEGYEFCEINSHGPIRIAEARVKRGRRRAIRMLIINAGNLPLNRPSKVIDLTPKRPKILRK